MPRAISTTVKVALPALYLPRRLDDALGAV